MRLLNAVLFSSSSLTASTSTLPLWIGHAYGFALQAIVQSGSASLTLQGSCDSGSDANPNSVNGVGVVNWSPFPLASASLQFSPSGSQLWNYEGVFFPWIQLVVTPKA